MTKANIDLPDGTKIVIDGSVDEVAKIVALVQGATRPPPAAERKPIKKPEAPLATKKKAKPGLKSFVRELKEEGFFEEKRTLRTIKEALDAKAHIYRISHLSGVMLELIRDRELGRLKERGKWVYVHRD